MFPWIGFVASVMHERDMDSRLGLEIAELDSRGAPQ
jgi:hypothetical protein